MTTHKVETIRRAIALADEAFESAENKRTGRIKQHQYLRGRESLSKLLQEAEQAEQAAARRSAERLKQTRRPTPQRFVMSTDDVLKLQKMDLAYEAALNAADYVAANEIIASKDYLRLVWLDELEDAQEMGASYSTHVGARATLVTKWVATFDGLERRIRELESAIPRYVGVYLSGTMYAKNSIVSQGGSMWIALQATDTRPPSDHWQCCVQRGRGK